MTLITVSVIFCLFIEGKCLSSLNILLFGYKHAIGASVIVLAIFQKTNKQTNKQVGSRVLQDSAIKDLQGIHSPLTNAYKSLGFISGLQ